MIEPTTPLQVSLFYVIVAPLIQPRCDGLNQDHPRLAGCL